MRVLIVESSGRGFLCHYAHALALGLHEAGCRVALLTGQRDELGHWPLPFAKQACQSEGWGFWRRLRQQLKRDPVDVVHIQWVDSVAAVLDFVRWARRRGIRVVYTPHNILPHRRRWFAMPLYRALYAVVDRVVARDRHIAWGLEELFDLPLSRQAFLPGSPNLMAHQVAPRRSLVELGKAPVDEFGLLYFGHGNPRKGLTFLLEFLCAQTWPARLHLMIAGEGVLNGISPELLAQVKARLRVTVIDHYVEAESVPELFSRASLLLLPYVKQCKSPLIDLAAAFAVPVLRSDRVQGAWFQEGRHGHTLPHDNPQAWMDVLSRLMAQPQALNEMRKALSKDESVTTAIGRLAGSHLGLYETLLAGPAFSENESLPAGVLGSEG